MFPQTPRLSSLLYARSTQEQLFISGGGLLPHLVKEITSNGMWCAGSLQTAFDLLGELCKGNREVSGKKTRGASNQTKREGHHESRSGTPLFPAIPA